MANGIYLLGASELQDIQVTLEAGNSILSSLSFTMLTLLVTLMM